LRSYYLSCLAIAAILDNSCSVAPEEPAPEEPAFEIAYRGLTLSEPGINLMNADGSDRRWLVTPADGVFCPSFSPDGGRIAYGKIRANQIAVIDLASGAETQLTSAPAWGQCPAWSPDGSRIAFFGGQSTANGFGLYTMNADGSAVHELAAAGFVGSGIDWSPDGHWLAVTSFSERTLVLVDAATGALGPPLSTGPETHDPDWSPDGRRLVYVRWDGGGSELYVVNADGTEQRRLTSSPVGVPYVNQGPRWSPDGAMIAYWRVGPPTGHDFIHDHLVAITSDGTERAWKDPAPIVGDEPFWRRRP
jgi:TolB protein